MTTTNRTNEEKNINKIILLGSTFVVFVVSLIIGYILINFEIKNFKNHLKTFKNTLTEREKFTIKTEVENLTNDILYEKKAETQRKEQKIKNQTTIAYNLALSLFARNSSKPKKEIVRIIKNYIENISKNEIGINYFIFSQDGTLILNTQRHKDEGKNFLNFKDINGKKFINEIIKKSEGIGSFVNYLWYKPNSSKIAKKITYSKKLKNLNITIGSGTYVDLNHSLSNQMIEKINNQHLGNNEFIYIYKINSLSDPKINSELILEKNIQTSEKELNAISKILKQSNYKADMFYEYDNRLIYSVFLWDTRSFISVGNNLEYINKIVENETVLLNNNLNKKIVSLTIGIFAIMLVFFMLSYIISKKIEKIFKNYRLKVIRNERKYQLLFNHSNDGFIISKITQDNKATIISSNFVAKKVTACDNSLNGENFFSFLVDFDSLKLLKNREYFGKIKLQTKEKTIKYIELNSVIYNDDSEILLFSSLRDVSERINLKNEKDKQQQLLIQKSKMASMGEMIGNIAHQWRQPLTQLAGLFFDIESAYDYNELDKKYLSLRIDEANDLVEYMSKTIDDFKEFYNPNSKKVKFNILDNTNQALKIVSSSFNMDILINIDKNIYIDGIENEFSQVILNLLKNSKEISLMRGVNNPEIKITSEITSDEILLHVEDNCGGIDDEIIDKIFEPYFTTKYNYGTGIGLYMSKVIIENKMGGRIFAKNVAKNISRFTIAFPIKS